jgi:hypothetical protein
MRIVFLDIDGVLNSVDWFKRRDPAVRKERDGSDESYAMCQIDDLAIGQLNRLVAETGAKMVISSTWRKYWSQEAILGMLRLRGFTGEVIGMTLDLWSRKMEEVAVWREVGRGLEIQAWMEDHPGTESFVILDDDSDMGLLRPRLTHVANESGLCASHVEEAVRLFGVPWEDPFRAPVLRL